MESYSDWVSPAVNPGAQTTIRNLEDAPRYDATEDYCSSYMVRLLVKCERKIETLQVKAASLLQTLGQFELGRSSARQFAQSDYPVLASHPM